MNNGRPDPDALLAHIGATDAVERTRGWLTVFFGSTAGVGKTYAMLEQARVLQREGKDVVAGVVETHGRAETRALLDGLEVLPRRVVEHRGVTIEELDLDAALARRPALLLVDELAHSNAPGSRHAKRWQDVEELLDAGIDVFTTVNVQHIESLNDVVARITHVRVRETVPDAVVAAADEVKLIDLAPEQLLKRLGEGKVYVPEQARRAISSFFRIGNLIALRQLALRFVAEHVDDAMLVYRRAHAVDETWPAAERLLVGVGPAPSSARLVRAAKRLADRLDAEWHAVFIESPEYAGFGQADRDRVWETLRLAERLGARTATITGTGVTDLLAYGRRHNVTRVLVGTPRRSTLRERLFGSRVQALLRSAADVDVYVVGTDARQDREPPAGTAPPRRVTPAPVRDYALAAGAIAAATVIAVLLRQGSELANLIMVYLLVVVGVAMRLGRGPSLFASVLAVAAFDFFCVPPYHTFAVADTRYLPVFGVMLLVAVVISSLTARLHARAEAARERERRTGALYGISRDLLEKTEPAAIIAAAVPHIEAAFDTRVDVLVPDAFDVLRPAGTAPGTEREDPVARWVFAHGRSAGRGTDTLPDADGLYVPIAVTDRVAGVLHVRAASRAGFADPERMHLLEAFARQLAVALEGVRVGEESRRARQAIEMGRLRTRFVSRASHELRTPLTSLALSVELLAERIGAQLGDSERALLDAAQSDLGRLRRLADDLLDLARLEAGAVPLRRGPVSPAALMDRAVSAIRMLATHEGVQLEIEPVDQVPDVHADADRIEGVLTNLLANGIRHAGEAGRVLVSAEAIGDAVQFSVADNGAGIPVADQERVFDEFVSASGPGGSGLGLAIARSAVLAHGGDIWVDSGPGPGAVFSFTLPVAAEARAS